MADDLFKFLDALWTKRETNGRPPIFMMHRFLASDPDYAQAARELQKDIREPEVSFHIWKGLLPKGAGAPRLSYVAPKKAPAEEELVAKIMSVESVRRDVAEEMVEMLRDFDKVLDAHHYYGLDT